MYRLARRYGADHCFETRGSMFGLFIFPLELGLVQPVAASKGGICTIGGGAGGGGNGVHSG